MVQFLGFSRISIRIVQKRLYSILSQSINDINYLRVSYIRTVLLKCQSQYPDTSFSYLFIC